VKVAAKDIDKYPLEWLNPFLLSPTNEKKKFYGISRFKPNLAQFLIMIMMLCGEKDIQIVQPKHVTLAF